MFEMAKYLFVVALGLIVLLGGYLTWRLAVNSQESFTSNSTDEIKAESKSKFGFLIGDNSAKDIDQVKKTGAGWVRPHPGPFIWGNIQETKDQELEFKSADDLVKAASRQGLSILATLWPFAAWDQISGASAEICQVEDEFTKTLGAYRCIPNNWSAYEQWLTATVERYDGDGNSDMPRLTARIKYWEIGNEPDLNGPGLRFLVGSPADYGQLLKRSYRIIKLADPEAQVLIAGAAGGDEGFLQYYRELFTDKDVLKSFDIANVHCISNDSYDSFNVEPYKKMLEEMGATKPIWVTEAETFISRDSGKNATLLRESTKKAFNLGAARIFYTALNFTTAPGAGKKPLYAEPKIDTDPQLTGSDPIKIYRTIFQALEKL